MKEGFKRGLSSTGNRGLIDDKHVKKDTFISTGTEKIREKKEYAHMYIHMHISLLLLLLLVPQEIKVRLPSFPLEVLW